MSVVPTISLVNFTKLLNAKNQPTSVFISDLHLDVHNPPLIMAFTKFLDSIENTNTKAIYILGDWFNAWLGDDCVDDNDFLWVNSITQKLYQLNRKGKTIFFCTGNRDFTLGQHFLDKFSGVLLSDISYLSVNNQVIRLEHGDLLCTDDKSYQRFRKLIRHPLINKVLNSLSLERRKVIAQTLRNKSSDSNQQKQPYIMDANAEAVQAAMTECDFMIHGHTHRPNIEITQGKTRFVLGDWRYEGYNSNAVIGILDDSADFQLINLVID